MPADKLLSESNLERVWETDDGNTYVEYLVDNQQSTVIDEVAVPDQPVLDAPEVETPPFVVLSSPQETENAAAPATSWRVVVASVASGAVAGALVSLFR